MVTLTRWSGLNSKDAVHSLLWGSVCQTQSVPEHNGDMGHHLCAHRFTCYIHHRSK